MKNILVSGASGIIGYGILRSLRRSKLDLRLIGITIYDDSVAQGFCDIFIKAPLTDDIGYIGWLVKIIKKHKIDLLFPGIDDDMHKWSENITTLNKCNAKFVLNNNDLIPLAKDKWKFYNYLKKENCRFTIPTSLDNNFETLKSRYGLPFLIKPRQGSASKGVVRICEKNTFKRYKKEIGSNLIVQPIIGSNEEEYTVSAFCDGKGGFYAYMSLKRKLSKQGFTEKAEVVKMKDFEEALVNICDILKPVGPTNFQFRRQNGSLFLLEINPRVSSATSIRSSFGYNESEMAVSYYLEGKTPRQPHIKYGKAVRYIEDKIFYK